MGHGLAPSTKKYQVSGEQAELPCSYHPSLELLCERTTSFPALLVPKLQKRSSCQTSPPRIIIILNDAEAVQVPTEKVDGQIVSKCRAKSSTVFQKIRFPRVSRLPRNPQLKHRLFGTR